LPDPLHDYQNAPPHDRLGDHNHHFILPAEQEDPNKRTTAWRSVCRLRRTTVLTLRETEFWPSSATNLRIKKIQRYSAVGRRSWRGEIDINFFL
jgi:hypothetical protein